MSLFQIMASVAVIFFAASSFTFALAETALLSLGDWRLRRLEADKSRSAVRIRALLGDPASLVSSLAFGTTTSNGLLITFGLLLALQSRWVVGVSLMALLPFVLIGCEVVPKTLAVRSPASWALRISGIIGVFHRLTLPLRRVASTVTDALLKRFFSDPAQIRRQMTDSEYEELIELAFQHGTIAENEKDIILQIIRLDQQTVRDVMRPRSQMIAISDELTTEQMMEAARKHGHRRLPIYDENPDTIVGILNARRFLLQPDADLSESIEFPSFVPETMCLLKLLRSFQRQKRGLAIVLDEYGGTAGLVTMTDILKELIGDIRSEGEESDFKMDRVGAGRWTVSGAMKVEEFRAEHPLLREHPEIDTMGGLLVSLLQIVPHAGQSVTVDGLRLMAQEVDERRVLVLSVSRVDAKRKKGAAA
jgi:putative hemolysin